MPEWLMCGFVKMMLEKFDPRLAIGSGIDSTAFLVACYATLHPALSVRPAIGPSVSLYFFRVFAVLGLTSPSQMIQKLE